MAELTQKDVEFYENYQAPTPGQSLTNSPDSKYPWESPPQFTNRSAAEVYIFEQLTDETVFLKLMDLVGDGTSLEALTTVYLYNGYSEGLWDADLLLLLVESVVFMIMALAEKSGIEYVLYDGQAADEEQEDADNPEVGMDKANNLIKQKIKKGSSQSFTNKNLEKKIEELPEEQFRNVKSLLMQDDDSQAVEEIISTEPQVPLEQKEITEQQAPSLLAAE